MKHPWLCALLLTAACTAPNNNSITENGNVPANTPEGTDNTALPGTPPAGTQPPGGDEQARGDVQLGASPVEARAGGTVTLRLTNGSGGTVGYNLCTSMLQTAAGAAVPTDRICTMELRSLPAGQSTTYAYELPARLESGRYRFSTDVERMESGERHAVTSNEIAVS